MPQQAVDVARVRFLLTNSPFGEGEVATAVALIVVTTASDAPGTAVTLLAATVTAVTGGTAAPRQLLAVADVTGHS